MFEAIKIKDAPAISLLKKLFLFLVVSTLVIGAVSSHRAYYQVKSLDVRIIDNSIIQLDIVGSGRTTSLKESILNT